MNWRYRLLHIDSLAGLSVGFGTLLLSNWLSAWYQLPKSFILLIAFANVVYGCFSLSLLVRKKRPLHYIFLLVIANLIWAILCIYWAFRFAQTASFLGLAHLLAEALFVGGLAYLEWRYRQLLLAHPSKIKATGGTLNA